MSFRRLLPFVYGLVAVAAAAIVYLPVTQAYFWADDFVWMLRFRDLPPLRVLVSVYGGHALLLRNLVFYGSWSLFGLDAGPYHWVAYVTHLANVALLFVLLRRATGSDHLGGLGALVWGTSPLCAGTLAWYSVYGHALVSTILLVVLCQVARARAPSLADGVRWSGLLLAGVLCFGVAVGFGIAFPAALFLFRPEAWRDRRLRVLLLALPVFVVALYFGYRHIAAWIAPLGPGEQFMLAASAASPATALPMAWHLLAVGTAGLLLGFFSAPLEYPGAVATTTLTITGVLAVLALLTGDARGRRQVVAALLLAAAAYGTIALGRAGLFAANGWSPGDAALQPRYHYAALVPLTLAICVVLQQLLRWRPLQWLEVLLVPLWIAGATIGFLRSPWSIDRAEEARAWVAETQRIIAARVVAAPPGATVSIPNTPLPLAAIGPVLDLADLPGLAGLFALLYPADVVDGHRILFLEPNAKVLAAVRAGPDRRLAALLTPLTPRTAGAP